MGIHFTIFTSFWLYFGTWHSFSPRILLILIIDIKGKKCLPCYITRLKTIASWTIKFESLCRIYNVLVQDIQCLTTWSFSFTCFMPANQEYLHISIAEVCRKKVVLIKWHSHTSWYAICTYNSFQPWTRGIWEQNRSLCTGRPSSMVWQLFPVKIFMLLLVPWLKLKQYF